MSFGIVDIVIIALALIFGVIGLVRGFRKTVFGLFASLLALVGAILLAGVLADLIIEKTSWDNSLVELLATKLSPNFTYGGAILEYKLAETGDAQVLGFYDGLVWHSFADMLEGTVLGSSILSGWITDLTMSFYPYESQALGLTFPAVLGTIIVKYAFILVLFIVLYIVLMIVVAVINRLAKKITSGTHIGHFLDKLLGFVLGIALAWVILMLLFIVLQVLSGLSFMQSVNDMLSSSFLAPYLVEYNFLYKLMDSLWGIGELGAKIGGIGL